MNIKLVVETTGDYRYKYRYRVQVLVRVPLRDSVPYYLFQGAAAASLSTAVCLIPPSREAGIQPATGNLRR